MEHNAGLSRVDGIVAKMDIHSISLDHALDLLERQ